MSYKVALQTDVIQAAFLVGFFTGLLISLVLHLLARGLEEKK